MDSEVIVRLHQGEYVGGDTIFGTVYVNLTEDIQSRTLKLIVKGTETTTYDYIYTEAIDQDNFQTKHGVRKEEKVFLKENHRMIEYPRGFSKGCYSFPFQYQLPHGVPGVFNIKHGDDTNTMEGNIKYTIGASFSNPTPRPKLQTEVPLIIYDSIECRNAGYVPSRECTSDKVQYLVCFNRGIVKLNTRLNKTAYCCDEVILLNVEVDNQSSIDVSSVTFTLNRVLRFFGKDIDRNETELTDKIEFTTLMNQNHSMIASGTKETWEQCIDLKNCDRLPPTTAGSIVRCRYHIDIKLHCSYALDIDQVQHIIIKPYSNVAWGLWEPPSWVENCTVSQVVAPLAVNREILYSNTFTNIPGLSWRTSAQ